MWHWILDAFLLICLILFTIDKLTFLWVRRCYGLVYSLVIRTSGYLIFIDIDNFKQFNEKYGHQVGDKILRQIGRIIQTESRLRGFRYGGDELAVLLPYSSKEKAVELAERVRSRIERANIKGLGVTVCCVVVQQEEEASKFLREAKRKGRNQVVVIND